MRGHGKKYNKGECMNSIISQVNSAQAQMCSLQGVPVFGPFVISPIKALFSTAQIIVSLAVTILLSLGTLLSCCSCFKTEMRQAELLMIDGARHLASSIANFLTLGITGYVFRNNL